MEYLLAEELLVFEVSGVNLFVLDLAFKDVDLAKVKSHVGSEDGTDHLLSYPLVLGGTQCLEDVVSLLLDYFESARNVEVFKDA